jgi:hypothetical protein
MKNANNNLINLDQGVIQALNFLKGIKLPVLNTKKYKFPIVVGSGNAYNAGQILFSNQPAFFSDETNFKNDILKYKKLIKNKIISEAIIISASGEKDSVWELKLAKKNNLKTILLTCSPNSSATKIADEIIVYPKINEPYTYNISTYLSIILSAGKEKPKNILKFLQKFKLKTGFKNFKAYSFIIPDKFSAINPMLDIKKSELFGPKISIRAFSLGQARHAKFVIRDKSELVITLGSEKNLYFGEAESRWQIALPSGVDFAFIFCLTYYLIGQIQKYNPPYFRKNIKKYCLDYGPKAYGSKNLLR